MELKLKFKGAMVTVETSDIWADPVDAYLESGRYDYANLEMTEDELLECERMFAGEIQQAMRQEQAETAHDRFEMRAGER